MRTLSGMRHGSEHDITSEQAAHLEALIALIVDGPISIPACPTPEDVERALQRATCITEPIEVSNVRIEGASLRFTLTLPRWTGGPFDLGGS